MDVFGELNKRHKSNTKSMWKRRGLICDDPDEIYERYLLSTHCEKCGNEYENRRDRCMDHCHSTGEFRNILCNDCNRRTDRTDNTNNTSGHANISTWFQKRNGYEYEYWKISIMFNGELYLKLFNKTKYTIEDAIAWRDDKYIELGIN